MINLYTGLDAYPLSRIDKMINNLARYCVFCTFDLRCTYLQVLLKEPDNKYTTFEGNGHLFQFHKIPFKVKNGATAFQRAIDNNERRKSSQIMLQLQDAHRQNTAKMVKSSWRLLQGIKSPSTSQNLWL